MKITRLKVKARTKLKDIPDNGIFYKPPNPGCKCAGTYHMFVCSPTQLVQGRHLVDHIPTFNLESYRIEWLWKDTLVERIESIKIGPY